MGLIIEIALGIVLAAIILQFLPLILAGGAALIGIAIALVMAWMLIYGSINNPNAVIFFAIFAAFIGAMLLVAKTINKKLPYLDIRNLLFAECIFMLWAGGTFLVLLSLNHMGQDSLGALAYFIPFTGFLVFAAIRWHKNLQNVWIEKKSIEDQLE